MKSMSRWLSLAALALLTGAGACTSSPASPSGVAGDRALSGTWIGTTSGPGFASSAARLVIQDHGLVISGAISARLGAMELTDAPVSGNAEGGAVIIQHLVLPPTTCADGRLGPSLVLIQLLAASSHMSGTYSYRDCAGAVGGDIVLSRE